MLNGLDEPGTFSSGGESNEERQAETPYHAGEALVIEQPLATMRLLAVGGMCVRLAAYNRRIPLQVVPLRIIPVPAIDPEAVKRDSEAIIRRAGGEICDWLPFLDSDTKPREVGAVVRRALILNAMLQIYFKAPIEAIKDWINLNGLADDLSESEREILEKEDGDLTEQERINLYWYIEALWTLAWAGQLIDELPFDEGVGDILASLCPALQRNEDCSKLSKKMRLRSHDELFRMLDLYYRLHWWTRNAQMTRKDTGAVHLDIIMERRKALEWIMDPACDWDNVETST